MYVCCVTSQSPPLEHLFFFLMIRRPPRSTLDRSSAASDVYKRQIEYGDAQLRLNKNHKLRNWFFSMALEPLQGELTSVSYTHLRAHETVLDLVCRLLLEKKKYSPLHTCE